MGSLSEAAFLLVTRELQCLPPARSPGLAEVADVRALANSERRIHFNLLAQQQVCAIFSFFFFWWGEGKDIISTSLHLNAWPSKQPVSSLAQSRRGHENQGVGEMIHTEPGPQYSCVGRRW